MSKIGNSDSLHPIDGIADEVPQPGRTLSKAGTSREEYDTIIIGAGVAGLLLASTLAEYRKRVLVVDSAARFATGASTKNEGWLHNGTYHAQSITNLADAMQVARRCKYGHAWIRGFAPEAIEDLDVPVLALTTGADSTERALERWRLAEVAHIEVGRRHLPELDPALDLTHVHRAFRVADASLNTRILYQKLIAKAEMFGAQMLRGVTYTIDANAREFTAATADGALRRATAATVVFACGYGIAAAVQAHIGVTLPMRYWKSHLLVGPRICEVGAFFIEPREAGAMHHGDRTVIGLNEDAVLRDTPDWRPEPDRCAQIARAVERLVIGRGLTFEPVACVKVDMGGARDPAALAPPNPRSLNTFVDEPLPGYFVLLPGKMSESPYIVHQLAQRLIERTDDGRVARRPLDDLFGEFRSAS